MREGRKGSETYKLAPTRLTQIDMPNEEIYHLDSPSDRLYILVKGELTKKQPKQRSKRLKAPITFGVESFILQFRHVDTVRNDEKKAELYSLDFHSFADVCDDYDDALVEDLQECAVQVWEELGGNEAAQTAMGLRRLSTHHANVGECKRIHRGTCGDRENSS